MKPGFVEYHFGDYAIRAATGSRLAELCIELKQEFPELRMSHARDRWQQRLRARLLFWNKAYLSHMTSTGKNRIDLSDDAHRRAQSEDLQQGDALWGLLLHERVHLRQFARWGAFLFVIIYGFVFFPTLFAWGRAWIEKPGYMETLRAWAVYDIAWLYARTNNDYTCVLWLTDQFVGRNYGWMIPFWKRRVHSWFAEEHRKLIQLEGAP